MIESDLSVEEIKALALQNPEARAELADVPRAKGSGEITARMVELGPWRDHGHHQVDLTTMGLTTGAHMLVG